jgi:sulfite oxidase
LLEKRPGYPQLAGKKSSLELSMRIDKLTTKLQEALSDAQSQAVGNDNQYIDPVHILIALLAQDDGGARSLLQRAGVNVGGLSAALKTALERLPKVTGTGGEVLPEGLDPKSLLVERSVPREAMQDAMLAWEMNGEPLPAIHGYPLRVVVFGYIGARSVKWLYRIKAIPQPTRAPVQSQEYLYFPQQVGKHNLRMTDGIQIQEMPVSSAIMSPWTKQVVIHEGKIRCKGWAYSGGGRWPERVELSSDGGSNWYTVPVDNMSPKRKWTWRTWEYELPCDVEGWIDIVCRCWDNALNTQPSEVRTAWNWGLHVTSSCHRISVYSVNKTRELTKARLAEFEERGVPFAPVTVPLAWPSQSQDDYEKFWATHDPRDPVDEI